MIKQSQPIFAVRDVKETIRFYEQVLGFANPWFWGDPVSYGGIGMGNISVMFNQMPDVASKIEGHQHHYWTDDINALHALHVKNGASIIDAIADRPWGLREYTVRDPNGYHLRFGGPIPYTKPASATSTIADHIRIERRVANAGEYTAITQSVGWNKAAETPRGLERSLLGAVAIDTRDGKAVGMARAMEDAYAWYSIWDVAVRPEYQSQRIGTALIESVLDQLRERGPGGAWVLLFTFQHKFYDRLGFKQETCTMRKL